ncbi:hypothetical protein ASE86_00230 [Sphingomonas sp. Leaf33]|uniref:hypothetical protein n=1 Tax=Sphingomonas sp. Leaf33 TaxID=1736215 RepID=UPI0006FD6254|nr:hypothetical protein [Sphingomonas sp. Leaf33]KQN24769.1 hypothetical protein ASE86_00230 [Sphingomonas sp. Leaf33]
MILAALLMLGADYVTVTSTSLDKFRAQVAFTSSGPQCRIKVSSGDADVDRVGCTAIESCYPTYQSRYATTSDREVRPSVRKVMRAALDQELQDCMKTVGDRGLVELTARRAGGLR